MGNKVETRPHSLIMKPENLDCPLCERNFENIDTLEVHIVQCKSEAQQKFLEIEKEYYRKLNTPVFRPYSNSSNVMYNYPFKNTNHNVVSSNNFENEVKNLRNKLNKLKIDWRDSHCTIDVNRSMLLRDSMLQIKKTNLFKELKINFIGEVSNDAGGIIREWFNELIKQLYLEKGKSSFI